MNKYKQRNKSTNKGTNQTRHKQEAKKEAYTKIKRSKGAERIAGTHKNMQKH